MLILRLSLLLLLLLNLNLSVVDWFDLINVHMFLPYSDGMDVSHQCFCWSVFEGKTNLPILGLLLPHGLYLDVMFSHSAGLLVLIMCWSVLLRSCLPVDSF